MCGAQNEAQGAPSARSRVHSRACRIAAERSGFRATQVPFLLIDVQSNKRRARPTLSGKAGSLRLLAAKPRSKCA